MTPDAVDGDYIRAKQFGWQDPEGDDGNLPLDPIDVEGVLSIRAVDSYGLKYTQYLVGNYPVDPDTIEVLERAGRPERLELLEDD